MGGFGSGRQSGMPTAEGTASYVIMTPILTRAGIGAGFFGKATVHFDDGEFPVEMTIDTRDNFNAHIQFVHWTRDDRHNDRVTYRANLTTTRPHYGGRRWWFVCPRAGRRTTKLFLPSGGWHFWSRQAYGLGYACQRETRADRLMRKARKLHRALGGHGEEIGDGIAPPKPKWMRWRTYERKVGAWRAADERADGAWTEGALRLIFRMGGRTLGGGGRRR